MIRNTCYIQKNYKINVINPQQCEGNESTGFQGIIAEPQIP